MPRKDTKIKFGKILPANHSLEEYNDGIENIGVCVIIFSLSLFSALFFTYILITSVTSYQTCIADHMSNATNCTLEHMNIIEPLPVYYCESVSVSCAKNKSLVIIYPSDHPDKKYYTEQLHSDGSHRGIKYDDFTKNYTCYWNKQNAPKLSHFCFEKSFWPLLVIGAIASAAILTKILTDLGISF